MHQEQVILVDQHDQVIGKMEKIAAHQQARLHRAFSVFVFRQVNNVTELLLQQRQFTKYHGGGLWSNTCCGHPRPHEEIVAAATRRLQEEFGFHLLLKIANKFHYTAKVTPQLTENEIDYVLIGNYNNELININTAEIANFAWQNVITLRDELAQKPQKFTPWFAEALQLALSIMNKI